MLVDTPGINEAAGELRGKLAEETVRYTDLVLFVADGDLNSVELAAFQQLSDLHKPIVLVINKADLYGPAQIREMTASILRKVGHRIGADDIVLAAAAPRESEREIHKADGTIEIVRFQPKPRIEALEARMLEVLDREGKAIIALNASLFATEVSDRLTALKQQVRGKEVSRLINYFMLGKALVVGANPVPVFDVVAGMASDARHGAAHRRHLRHRLFAQERPGHGARHPARLGADGGGRVWPASRRRPVAHRDLRHLDGHHRSAAGPRRGVEHLRRRPCRQHLFPRFRLERPLAKRYRAGNPRRLRKAEDQHSRTDPGSAESEVRTVRVVSSGRQESGKHMIGRLNHVAIAVRDIGKAAAVYRDTLGADVSAAVPQPDHGVTTVFITLPNTKIELLEPLGKDSPIAKFLERNPDGGMHHVCYEVDDIRAARDALKAAGARVLGDGEPKTGAHGKPVLFLHPKDFSGTLVELEQA